MASICCIECSWLLRRSRACFQSQNPFLTRKCAHLVVSAHISQQVKHLTQVCEREKQSQRLSATSPLWFWQRIRFVVVVHFRDEFLSFLCFGTSCFRNVFSSQCQKNLLHISTNIPTFFPVYWLAPGPRDRTVARQSSIGVFTFVRGAWRSRRGAWHSNLTKISRIYSVSYFNLGAWSCVWGGLRPPKPPRGDGTAQRPIARIK